MQLSSTNSCVDLHGAGDGQSMETAGWIFGTTKDKLPIFSWGFCVVNTATSDHSFRCCGEAIIRVRRETSLNVVHRLVFDLYLGIMCRSSSQSL